MPGHNPKQPRQRREFPGKKKQQRRHMHSCTGDGKLPCPRKQRVTCGHPILHNTRCPPCSSSATERTLFGTPTGPDIAG